MKTNIFLVSVELKDGSEGGSRTVLQNEVEVQAEFEGKVPQNSTDAVPPMVPISIQAQVRTALEQVRPIVTGTGY